MFNKFINDIVKTVIIVKLIYFTQLWIMSSSHLEGKHERKRTKKDSIRVSTLKTKRRRGEKWDSGKSSKFLIEKFEEKTFIVVRRFKVV